MMSFSRRLCCSSSKQLHLLKCNTFLNKQLLTIPVTCSASPRRSIFNKKKGFNRDWITFLQQEIDLRPSAIERWKKKVKWGSLVKHHEHNADRAAHLGSDLAIAHFILVRGGAVRFRHVDQWFESIEPEIVPPSIPNTFNSDFEIEAIDASNTDMMYCSFDNIDPVEHLRYINLSDCKYIDDWCLDRLVIYSKTLEYLDVSGCSRITERGLATLHKLSNLKRLRVANLMQVSHRPLVAIMLEEMMPNCVIEGMDTTVKLEEYDIDTKQQDNSFEAYEQLLLSSISEEMTGRQFKAVNFKF